MGWAKATHTLAVNTVPWVQKMQRTKVKQETKYISQIRNYLYPNGTSQKVKWSSRRKVLNGLMAELDTWDSHGKRDSNPVSWPCLHIHTRWISASALGIYSPSRSNERQTGPHSQIFSIFNAYLRILILTRTFRSQWSLPDQSQINTELVIS